MVPAKGHGEEGKEGKPKSREGRHRRHKFEVMVGERCLRPDISFGFLYTAVSEGHKVSVNLPLADAPLILHPFFGLDLDVVRGEIASQCLGED